MSIGLIINEYQIKYFKELQQPHTALIHDTEACKVSDLLSHATPHIEHIILDDAVTFALYHQPLFDGLIKHCSNYIKQLWLVTQSLAEFNAVLPRVATPDTTKIHLARGYASILLSSDDCRIYRLYPNQNPASLLTSLFEV